MRWRDLRRSSNVRDVRGRRVTPDSFTHGSSAERQEWLQRGLESADPAACETFGG